MRRSEVLGLQWRDLDLENRSIVLERSVTAVDGKSVVTTLTARTRRTVYLDATTVDALRAHRAATTPPPDEWVFGRRGGGLPNPASFSTTFDRLVERAGVTTIRVRDVRHTYATLALKNGVHIVTVSERLGHAFPSVTLDRYSHVMPPMSRDAVDAVARAIWPEPT